MDNGNIAFSPNRIMLRTATHIRYHIAAILAAHWVQFVAQHKRWIRPGGFENVRKVLACRSPVLGCHIYQCKDCGHVELVPHFQDKHFPMIRYAGLFSNRWKRQYLSLARIALNQSDFDDLDENTPCL